MNIPPDPLKPIKDSADALVAAVDDLISAYNALNSDGAPASSDPSEIDPQAIVDELDEATQKIIDALNPPTRVPPIPPPAT